jgi:WD40 repeat protein
MTLERDDFGSAPERESRLSEVIAEYLLAMDAGNAPPPGDVLARHPDLRAKLEVFFAGHRELSHLSSLGPAYNEPRGPDRDHPVFGGHELIEEIARGGMGVVYRAREVALGRTVALKVILAGTLATRKEVDRFLTEARAAASLDHPNIVPIYSVAESNGRHFYTMKLLEGGDLARNRGRFLGKHRAIAQLIEAVARAVHHAHLRGVLHRDLKPANILLDPEGMPHVTDFGLSKRLDADQGLTRTGEILGTPNFVAPEQVGAGAGRISAATDIYSLGAILYDLLADRPPFRESDPLATLRAVIEKEPAPPRHFDPGVPRDLETICLKCLEKEPHRRYATADELARDLDRYLAGLPVFARRSTWLERTWSRARRKPLVAGLAASVALLTLVVAMGSLAFSFRLGARLHDSLRAQVHAEISSDRMGRRFRALKGIEEAARLQSAADLRDDAITALALTDLRFEKSLPGIFRTIERPAALDPRFQVYAACEDGGGVTVRRVGDLGVVARLETGGSGATAPVFSADGRLLAARLAGPTAVSCRVWSLERPSRPVLDAPAAIGLRPYGFHPARALLAVAGPTGEITFRDFGGADADERVFEATRGVATVEEVAFSTNGEIFAVSARSSAVVAIRSTADGRVISTLPYSTPTLAWEPYRAWDPRNIYVALVRSEVDISFVHVLRVRRRSGEITGNEGVILELAYAPDGGLLGAATADGSALLWNPRSCRPVLRCPDGRSVQFSTDGARLAITRWSTIEVFEIVRSGELKILEDPRRLFGDREVTALSFCPREERLLVASTASWATLFDLDRGTRVADARLPASSGGTAVDRPLRRVEREDGGLTVELGPPAPRERAGEGDVRSPDGSRRIRCEPSEYLCFRAGSTEPVWRIARGGGWSRPGPAAFSADGALLGLISAPLAVTLVDPASGRTLATLRPPEPDPPRDLVLSPSGRFVVVNLGWGTLFVWDLGAVAASLDRIGVRGDLPRFPDFPEPVPSPVRLELRE